MRRWQWFSGGVVLGLLVAMGFGFAAVSQQTERDQESAPVPKIPVNHDAVLCAADAQDEDDDKLHIVCFGAHPDDCEINAGGVGALWAEQGHHVHFVSATNGDIGHWQMAGGPLAIRRHEEVQKAARLLGVKTTVLDIHDGELMPTLDNRRIFTRHIRRGNADIVMGHRPNDYHPDHRYTGVLMQDSAFMVAVPYFCPDTPHLTKNPVFLYYWDRFEIPNRFEPDVVVSIDRVIEKKTTALVLMESQFVEGGALGYNRPPIKDDADREARRRRVRASFERRFAAVADRYRDKLIELYGEELGKQVKYAEAFEVCEYGRQPTQGQLKQLFPFFPK